jgi:hypothetical protein
VNAGDSRNGTKGVRIFSVKLVLRTIRGENHAQDNHSTGYYGNVDYHEDGLRTAPLILE